MRIMICPTDYYLDKVDVATSEEGKWYIGWQTTETLFISADYPFDNIVDAIKWYSSIWYSGR